MPSTPYVRTGRTGIPSPAELRARIPGWGADLDPADRPAVPRELPVDVPAHVHWDYPPEQEELVPRERSIEHAQLTPVFGTTYPPRGLSGKVRRHAYERYSEARAAHWLLLLAADRIDAVESAFAGASEARAGAVAGRAARSVAGTLVGLVRSVGATGPGRAAGSSSGAE